MQEDMMPIHDDKYNEHESVLSDWFQQAKDKVLYIYDFGDDWIRDIVLMKVLKRNPNKTYPCCTKIRNLPPPEDSRGKLIQGEIDLEWNDTEQLLIEMNEMMNQEIDDSVSEDLSNDYWQDVLSKAKTFLKLKPWERMADNDIFAVVDPVTEETLFCSILGANETTFGLGVYIGIEGYSALNDIMNGSDDFEIILRQRSLLLSFVNRESNDERQYDLIKTYDIPFRGRNAWPEFISMKPGAEPWYFDNEDARMMVLAIGEAIDVYHQVIGGLELPRIYNEDQVFSKVPVDKDGTTFENKMLDLTAFNEEALARQLSFLNSNLNAFRK